MNQPLKYNPALDGLRAVAIAMVIAYHVNQSAVPAGYWGVILFFVLSGYLLTRQLVAEVEEDGRIDLGKFYLKRALRLVPALAVVCIVLLFLGVGWSQVGPAIGHYANYARIAGQDLGPLTHTWFLAVMAHFYLLWPLLIAAVPRERRVLAVGVLAVAALAWKAIATAVVPAGWVYNATDTNAAALLAGCFLAVARPRPWRFAGWSILALLILMFFPVFGEEGAAFLWADFLAIALAVTILQYAVGRPESLETGRLLWLGEISYGLYLWHYVFLNMEIPLWVALPLSFVAAVASWYVIEKPILKLSARLGRNANNTSALTSRVGRA
ncbi:MAG TPA: acyltransferase [Acidimicrobiia bacterium]